MKRMTLLRINVSRIMKILVYRNYSSTNINSNKDSVINGLCDRLPDNLDVS